MSSIIQYGKQANQPIQLLNINTFYRSKSTEITFVFCNGHTQVWKFPDEIERDAVFVAIIQRECVTP